MEKFEAELCATSRSLVAPGKGILAADEPLDYMGGSLKEARLENTEENRRRYRQLLFTAPRIADHISGVILHPETVRQTTDDGLPFVELLRAQGIVAGVNVDGGLVPLPRTDGETTTQGLDGLGDRCRRYKEAGCLFAKWRCALRIAEGTPSARAVRENATVLARYASVCQENGLVPVVEPEVQLEGSHGLERARAVTETVLAAVYGALRDHGVLLEGTLLKPSMVTQGRSCPVKSAPSEIAAATVAALRRTVPAAVPGVGFLSGGQSAAEATENLSAINKCGRGGPWALTFIFGRALQAAVPGIWSGKEENVGAAQQELVRRSKDNGRASLGLDP